MLTSGYCSCQQTSALRLKEVGRILTVDRLRLTCIIQEVPGENVNILGSHSIGHSKQKYNCTRALFRKFFEMGLLLYHCTVAKMLIRKIYHAFFLHVISVFIFQVTNSVRFTK
jgi:hypothetical protein